MQSTNPKPWYQWVRRWGQTNLTEDDPARNNIDFWKTQWTRTHVQGVIVNCGGTVAYYPSKYGLQYRAATLGDRDYFREFSEAAQAAGLVVIARMDINRATEAFYRAHPDWFCRDKEGRPIMSQGRYFSCVNSDYYKKYIPEVLTEIIETYHPAGFADNSWKGMGRGTICYCDSCRTQFEKHAGLALPEAVDWEDPAYRQWVRWGYACRTENWDLFNEVTQRVGGEDCLWLGMLHADPANLSGTFTDLKALCERSKFIFSDQQSRDLLNGFEQNSLNGALLRLASEEQVLVPESMASYVRGPRTFRLASTPSQEYGMWVADGIAGGISPWFHHIGGGTRDRRQFDATVPFFAWHAKNERYLYDRTSLANVGVVWHQQNADFYGRENARERVALPWRGMTLALAQDRIPFLPVHADDIDRYRARLETLILPDVAILTREQVDAVLRFLDRGGNLVLTGKTGTLDGDGNPSGDLRLWERLGLRLTGETQGAFDTQPADWEYPLAHTYLQLPEQRPEILRGFEQTDILGFGGGLCQAESNGPLMGWGGYVKPFPIYPPEFSWVREVDEALHPLYSGQLASGSRIVYFAADIDRCFGRDRLPDHGRLLANAIRWAAGDTLRFAVEGPGFLDTAFYAQGQDRIVHLVNLNGANRTPGYLDEVLPVGPVTVRIPMDRQPARVQLLVAGEEVPLTYQAGMAQARIPQIGLHEVLVFSADKGKG